MLEIIVKEIYMLLKNLWSTRRLLIKSRYFIIYF